MRNIIYINTITILCILFIANINILRGQSSKKQLIEFDNKLNEIKISDIKKGNHLEIAKELSVDKFVQYYLEEGKKVQSKKYGDYIIFEELYEDYLFAYFGRTYTYGLVDFIKVLKKEFPSRVFNKLDGQELRSQFINEVIPQEDKSRIKRKEKRCSSIIDSHSFTYRYVKCANEIEIKYHWRVKCDFLYIVINKEYVARYNIDKEEFVR